MERKPIGLKDNDGVEIHVGDVVEFFFCADHGAGMLPQDVCECPPTRMVDEVIEDGGKFYFQCPGHGGAFAWRYNDVCRVIGTLPDNFEMFWAANKNGLLT
jgi:hypothetical protein